jgi:hypothetical protein
MTLTRRENKRKGGVRLRPNPYRKDILLPHKILIIKIANSKKDVKIIPIPNK